MKINFLRHLYSRKEPELLFGGKVGSALQETKEKAMSSQEEPIDDEDEVIISLRFTIFFSPYSPFHNSISCSCTLDNRW